MTATAQASDFPAPPRPTRMPPPRILLLLALAWAATGCQEPPHNEVLMPSPWPTTLAPAACEPGYRVESSKRVV